MIRLSQFATHDEIACQFRYKFTTANIANRPDTSRTIEAEVEANDGTANNRGGGVRQFRAISR